MGRSIYRLLYSTVSDLMKERKPRVKLVEKLDTARCDEREKTLYEVMEYIDGFIDGYYELRETNPNNIKFVDICLDALEELRDKYIYEHRLTRRR